LVNGAYQWSQCHTGEEKLALARLGEEAIVVKRDLKIEDFKNRYLGQRVFIVGNGPSTTPEILDQIKSSGWATFGMNRIGMIFPRTSWRPKFYIGTTSAINDPMHRPDNLAGIRSSEIAFCCDGYKIYLDEDIDDNVIYLYCSQLEDWLGKHKEANDDFWSDDIAKRLSKYGATAFPAMQVAAYLGLNPIYLIGCDAGYKPPIDGVDPSHFDPQYRPWHAYPSYENLNLGMQRAHEIAQVAADRLGIEIFNISPISKITAHRFTTLDEALS